MGVFKNIFTWWEGATFGTWLGTKVNGVSVGEDHLGNRYFEARSDLNGFRRRWVLYAGANDASRVPPEWHCWLHHMVEDLPDRALPPKRNWQLEPLPNQTGTQSAYRPSGAGPQRATATGDYSAWTPDQA